jgi:hypothetical protein
VDSDAYDSVTTIPALEDFMLDPLAVCSFRSNEEGSDARVLQLVIDPVLDCTVTLFLDRFPLSGINEAVFVFGGDYIAVSDLPCTPSVTFIMEAKKDFASHSWSPFLKLFWE